MSMNSIHQSGPSRLLFWIYSVLNDVDMLLLPEFAACATIPATFHTAIRVTAGCQVTPWTLWTHCRCLSGKDNRAPGLSSTLGCILCIKKKKLVTVAESIYLFTLIIIWLRRWPVWHTLLLALWSSASSSSILFWHSCSFIWEHIASTLIVPGQMQPRLARTLNMRHLCSQ